MLYSTYFCTFHSYCFIWYLSFLLLLLLLLFQFWMFRWKCWIKSVAAIYMDQCQCKLCSYTKDVMSLITLDFLISGFMSFGIQVAESVSKYCVLLHISEGSADAAHFSAICILLVDMKKIILFIIYAYVCECPNGRRGFALTYCQFYIPVLILSCKAI